MEFRIKAKILFIFQLICVLAFSQGQGQSQSQTYLLYIDQYHQIALKQQKEYGIPASITLAQGLLESGAGNSAFAKESNNHFGIKCTDWTGETIFHDDDENGECFRKYNEVIESYEDHSLFLKNKPRYAFLFQLEPTDYEGWAYGLKKAGYATDPVYAYKLISIIENYNLHQYDLGKNINDKDIIQDNNPESKKKIREKRVDRGSMGAIVALVSHEVKKVNGVKFVTALPGDNYSTIADEFNISEKRLSSYNDLASNSRLLPGTRVFISSKKNKAPKECLKHKVLSGESMYSISQNYGIKVIKLYELNKMSFAEGARLGQVLKLR